MRPILLRPNNFTDPARAPWGGTKLVARYKAGLGVVAPDETGRVGESWELSVSEELPSRTADGALLSSVLAAAPAAMLGDEARLGRTTTSLLVKWLDAADELSLQIDPEDDYAGLGPGEAGKFEAWYVVEADPGAGYCLGFAPGVTRDDVQRALRDGGDLRRCMRFVPAAVGDLTLIDPGMPHAVGRGLLLIEPQRVRPGRRALTYRYWDFDRRYDGAGKPDPHGAPRPLHVAHALAVTAWERACDPDYLARRLIHAGAPSALAPACHEPLAGPEPTCPLRSDALRIERLSGTGHLRLPAARVLRSLTVIAGRVVLGPAGQQTVLDAGSTAALPAALPEQPAALEGAHALLCSALG